jgi:predicted HAD superfamily Cof-like phosphohydrolase
MEFEGMTPQEAAAAIVDQAFTQRDTSKGVSLQLLEEIEERIAAACQHFLERGQRDAIDPQSDVRQFMHIAKQAIPERPQWPDQETMDLRVRLIAEEFCEWLRDSGYGYNLIIDGDRAQRPVFSSERDEEPRALPRSADALIDLLYVTIGSLLAMGIDMWPLWAEVNRANMAKLGGPVINGKLCKPEGWKPPDIKALLRKQGWEE